jgi:hypothetical protein
MHSGNWLRPAVPIGLSLFKLGLKSGSLRLAGTASQVGNKSVRMHLKPRSGGTLQINEIAFPRGGLRSKKADVGFPQHGLHPKAPRR